MCGEPTFTSSYEELRTVAPGYRRLVNERRVHPEQHTISNGVRPAQELDAPRVAFWVKFSVRFCRDETVLVPGVSSRTVMTLAGGGSRAVRSTGKRVEDPYGARALGKGAGSF